MTNYIFMGTSMILLPKHFNESICYFALLFLAMFPSLLKLTQPMLDLFWSIVHIYGLLFNYT